MHLGKNPDLSLPRDPEGSDVSTGAPGGRWEGEEGLSPALALNME